MPSPDPQAARLAGLMLAGSLLLLPWTIGGRSPTGQALAVLLPLLAVGPIWLAAGPRLRRPAAALLLGAGILAAGSAAQTIYPDRTVQTLLLWLGYTAAGTAAAHCARAVAWGRPLLLGAIALSGLAAGLAGTLSVLRGAGHGMYGNQLTGPFGYPNAMAGFLLLAAGAAAALAVERLHPGLRLAALAGAGLLVSMLWLTGSRGAGLAGALGAVVGVGAATLPGLRRPGRAAALAALGVGTAGAAWLRILPVPSAWPLPAAGMAAAPAGDTSLLWRWHILQWTWDMIRDHPWLGVGPGGFPVALTHYQRIPYVSGENPHNLPAQVAAEFGIPFLLVLLAALAVLLARLTGLLLRDRSGVHPAGPSAALLGTLVAWLAHSLVDMAWAFPAVAVGAAVVLGLGAAALPQPADSGTRRPLPLRLGIAAALAAVALLALSRFYASSLVESGRQALNFGASPLAVQDLTWALRLNPASFPARVWLAQAQLRRGDPAGALAVAEGAARLAPADPNGAFLAGEIAAAAGQWARADGWFQAAAVRAPSAQLRFHAAAVEAAARAGDASAARGRYERAFAIFSPERVLHPEARCLSPGDRYLLARMSRIAADLYAAAGDQVRSQAAGRVARQLAQPDTRGICAVPGREGWASPEAAMVSFWNGLGNGGWREAERFLAPSGRGPIPDAVWRRWAGDGQAGQSSVSWVAALSGNESRVTLTVELLANGPVGQPTRRCARGSLRILDGSWFLEELPQVSPAPCTP